MTVSEAKVSFTREEAFAALADYERRAVAEMTLETPPHELLNGFRWEVENLADALGLGTGYEDGDGVETNGEAQQFLANLHNYCDSRLDQITTIEHARAEIAGIMFYLRCLDAALLSIEDDDPQPVDTFVPMPLNVV